MMRLLERVNGGKSHVVRVVSNADAGAAIHSRAGPR